MPRLLLYLNLQSDEEPVPEGGGAKRYLRYLYGEFSKRRARWNMDNGDRGVVYHHPKSLPPSVGKVMGLSWTTKKPYMLHLSFSYLATNGRISQVSQNGGSNDQRALIEPHATNFDCAGLHAL